PLYGHREYQPAVGETNIQIPLPQPKKNTTSVSKSKRKRKTGTPQKVKFPYFSNMPDYFAVIPSIMMLK
ncbi:MAG: hypothetical protein IJN41_03690, partial [Firmicutes bacterium]|nr:hypothetical protein [Bacillota bacterium]